MHFREEPDLVISREPHRLRRGYGNQVVTNFPKLPKKHFGKRVPPGGQSLGSEWEFTKDRLTDARACDMPNAQTQGSLKKLGTKVA